ncbi:MAG TPA: hypothetical protein H9858_05120 [Candidatus Blautia stercoravium]|nr:hypothetical protein [Candidatus Blautia stercoravium]
MKEERTWGTENLMDMETRMQNLLWTVCGDYAAEADIDIQTFQKSRYIAYYDVIRQGMFRKYFDTAAFDAFITQKVYQGASPSVLLALARLCIDSAVHEKAAAERKGVASIRQKAFADTLEKDAMRLTHTDWGYLEACYLRRILYNETADSGIEPLLDKICSLSHTDSVEEICRRTEEIYRIAYEKGFAQYFKGLPHHVKTADKNQKEYTDKQTADEVDDTSEEEHFISIFSGHVDAQDNGQRPHSSVVQLDRQSSAHLKEYIELNYGTSCLTPLEHKVFQEQMCRGIHRDCLLHVTKGVLHSGLKANAKSQYVQKIKEENLRIYQKNLTVTRQNIQMLANTLKRALLTRTDPEIYSSDYGNICVHKLWNVGRTDNTHLFQRQVTQDNLDFTVEVLIDASGSQQRRQSLVALQGYIISEALSIVRIPHRVIGFCTFGAYTVLTEYRDYEDGREANEHIFEFYGSANNRDGLAVKAAADSLDKQPQENKILIVLSDGRPNDIIAANLKKQENHPQKEPYCLDFAVKDTASEIRKLRNRNIAVLGVFAGEEEDLPAEKKIFGKDFAYIHDISVFAHVVGRYLEKKLLPFS